MEILHRRTRAHEFSGRTMAIFSLVMLISGIGWSRPIFAQDELPQIMPSEHKLPTKKDFGPRAVAILQLSSKGKASLVPVAIMINGKFWDASAYKADPIPMSLESGTVYEVERDGSSQGLFTVGSALHSNAANAQIPWLGTGAWVPAGTEKKNTVMTTAITPVGLTDTDAPPRLTRDPAKVYPQAQPASGSPPPQPSGKSSGSSGDEPPRLSKPASESSQDAADSKPSNSSQPSSSQPGSSQSGSAQTPASPSAPTGGGKPDSAKASRGENVPVDDSGADAANRPVLRRGRPAVSFADEDIPGYSKPGVTPSSKPAPVAAKAESAPEPVQLIPAVSDAHGPDPHSYAFEFLKGEEEQRHDQMVTLAKQQLAAYLKAESKEEITPESRPSRGLHRVTEKKAPEPIFDNPKMVAFDLWLTNQPLLIFTAEAHLPPSKSGAPTGPYSNLTYSITIAAYPDIYNNLHKLYVGVTDKYHLDVTPRLELIDAVDADGDGRGELLFRETSDAGTGWVIYRATADSLWKMYDSLNPE